MKIKRRSDKIKRFDTASAEMCYCEEENGFVSFGWMDKNNTIAYIGQYNEEKGFATFYEPREAFQDCEMQDYEYRIWSVPLENLNRCMMEFHTVSPACVVKRFPEAEFPMVMFPKCGSIARKYGGECVPYMKHWEIVETQQEWNAEKEAEGE